MALTCLSILFTVLISLFLLILFSSFNSLEAVLFSLSVFLSLSCSQRSFPLLFLEMFNKEKGRKVSFSIAIIKISDNKLGNVQNYNFYINKI